MAQAHRAGTGLTLSIIRTVTVGPGISPGLLTLHSHEAAKALAALVRPCCHAAITAGGEFHPALRTLVYGTGPNDEYYRFKKV